MIAPKPDAPSDVYDLIREAIEQRQHVFATYEGLRREMCPHALGSNKQGEAMALFYQFGGESHEPLGPTGSPDNWRCLRIAELSNVSLRPGDWHTAPHHTRPDTCIFHRLDLSITQALLVCEQQA